MIDVRRGAQRYAGGDPAAGIETRPVHDFGFDRIFKAAPDAATARALRAISISGPTGRIRGYAWEPASLKWVKK